MFRFVIGCIVSLAATVCRAETPPPVLALNGLDPVALAKGEELPGSEKIESSRGRFTYRFATDANRKSFLAKPSEYSVQFAGACGRMGPFTGTGNPARYFVFAGRIYLFASEACRDAFKKDPLKYIEHPNAIPQGTEDDKKRGLVLIAKALDGFGGAKAVDALQTLERVEKLVYKQGEKETVGSSRTSWSFPDSLRVEADFGKPYGTVITRGQGFEFYGQHHWPMDPDMYEVARRQLLREPLAMLRQRNHKDFVAFARGANVVDVALDGATSTWTLDEKTGRILKTEFKARRGSNADIAVSYSDFAKLKDVVLPRQRSEAVNAKPITAPERRLESLKVNDPVAPDAFRVPK